MSNRFHNEDDIQAAYEAAELIVSNHVARNLILVPDERQPTKGNTIRKLARDIADAVIRSDSNALDDITDLRFVNVERVDSYGEAS